MRADEALAKSDKIQYDDATGSIASLSGAGHLRWERSQGIVTHVDSFRDRWQPVLPEPKCPACIKADELLTQQQMIHNVNITTPIIDHLKTFHCSCKED